MSKTDWMMRPRDGDGKQKKQFPYSAGFVLPKDKQPPQNTHHAWLASNSANMR